MYQRFKEIFRTDNRIFGLDILRFTAIVLVVFGHSRWMTASFPKPLKLMLYGSGILGVELFFVLSGFLIGGILLKQFQKNGCKLDTVDIKKFWVRRWLRTLPNYYLILLVYIIVYFAERPEGLWRYVFFVQNIWNHPPYFFEESWSLCIEEISYLISPLVLALSAKFFGKNGKGKANYFLYTSFILIVIVTILRMIYSSYFLLPGYKWSYHFREVALIRLDAIYYGFIAAFIASNYADFWRKARVPLFIIGLTGILTLMAFQKNLVEVHGGLLTNTFFFTFLSIAIAFVIPYLSSVKSTNYQWIAKPITAVSIISYSLYLVNGGLLAESFKRYTKAGAGWTFSTAIGVYLFYWFLCLAISAIIYVAFEKPMTDLRNKMN